MEQKSHPNEWEQSLWDSMRLPHGFESCHYMIYPLSLAQPCQGIEYQQHNFPKY